MRLRDLGNTVLLVEHDPLTIAQADYVLDFGPRSGRLGGYITAKGSVKQILKSKDSLTGSYLSTTICSHTKASQTCRRRRNHH